MFFSRVFSFRGGPSKPSDFSPDRQQSRSRCRRKILKLELLEQRTLLSVAGIDAVTNNHFVEQATPAWEVASSAAWNNTETVDVAEMVLCCDPLNPTVELPQQPSLPEFSPAVPRAGGAATFFDPSQTFILHSNPSAKHTIYLDFTGHVTQGTLWNTYAKQATITTQPWSLDNDFDHFSELEQVWVREIWARVSEDFLPFDVDVTTEKPPLDHLIKSGDDDDRWGVRVVFGSSYNDWFGTPAGGVAYVNSFTSNVDTSCFVFTEIGKTPKHLAEAASHEIGHTLGLNHDGKGNAEYYAGHGDWAPIMGNSYEKAVSQWSCGEYSGAMNHTDELFVITSNNGFNYRTDDHGDVPTKATRLSVTNGIISDEGVIERNTDSDVFGFTITDATEVYVEIRGATFGSNLDVKAELLDADGTVLYVYASTDSCNVAIRETLAAGDYFLRISGDGCGDPAATGYSNYGSLGYYSIYGAIPFHPEAISMEVTGAVLDDTAVRLTWSRVLTAIGYRVYRQGADGDSPVLVYDGPATGFVDTGLRDGTTNDYKIVAMAPGGTFLGVTATVSVTIPETVYPPALKQPAKAYSVTENSRSGTRVATLTPLTPTSKTRVYGFSLIEGGEWFTLDAKGVLSVKPGVTIDYETTSTLQIVVETTVNGTRAGRDAFTIGVKDVNEPPKQIGFLVTGETVTEAELLEGELFVAPLTARDPDGATVTYRLGGKDAGLFTIVQNGEGWAVQAKSPLDFENSTDRNRDGVYELTITATDATRKSASQNVFIRITDRVYRPDEIVRLTGMNTAWTARQVGGNIQILNGNVIVFAEPATAFPAVEIAGTGRNNTLNWELGASAKSSDWSVENAIRIRFDGNGGRDSVKVIGTVGNDEFRLTSAGIGFGASFLTLTGVAALVVEGGGDDDRYVIESLPTSTTISDSRGANTLVTDTPLDLKSRRMQEIGGVPLTLRSTFQGYDISGFRP